MTRSKKQSDDMIPRRFCIPLQEAASAEHAGGKGSSLAKLQALGVRVPESIVLLSEALCEFLHVNGLEGTIREYQNAFQTETNKELIDRYTRICRHVRDGIVPAAMRDEVSDAASGLLSDAPGGLAIRSSAAVEDAREASFAGVFESFLGCSRASEVMKYVKDVWCSLWAPKAIRYMMRMEIDPLICGIDSMAVIIQKVVPARCAGVIHTADTETGNPWRFVLHATEGLSVRLMGVSGAGDRLVLDWETGSVLEQEIGDKDVRLEVHGGTVREKRVKDDAARRPALDGTDIGTIAGTARTLDEALDMRLDIEWALDDQGLVVVQARPLTALPEFFPHVLSDEENQKRWWASAFHGGPRPGVFNGTPQPGAEFIPPFFGDLSGQEMWMRYQPKEFVFYADPDKEDKDVNGYRFATTVKWRTFSDYIKGDAETESWFMKHEDAYRRSWAGFWADLDKVGTTSSEAIRQTTTAIDLIPVLLQIRESWADLTALVWGAPQCFGWICEELLNEFCRKHVSPAFKTGVLLASGADSFTFRQTKALQELGKSIREHNAKKAFNDLPASEIVPWLLETDPDCAFLQAFESFCWTFGRRPPSWYTRSSLWNHKLDRGSFFNLGRGRDVQAVSAIKQTFLSQARDVVATREAARLRRARQAQEIRDLLSEKNCSLPKRFDRIADWALFWTQVLNDRHAITIAGNWLYELLWHVGYRLCREGLLDEPTEVLVLYPEDLERIVRLADMRKSKNMFRDRKRAYARNRRLTPPALLGKHFDWKTKKDNARAPSLKDVSKKDTLINVFFGQGNCRGEATGKVRKTAAAEDPTFLDSMTPDDIVVMTVPMASPFVDWHSLLMTARGVVSAGKPYHHLVQVANECDVPLIESVQGDLSLIPDQAMIHIDADSGEIRVLGNGE